MAIVQGSAIATGPTLGESADAAMIQDYTIPAEPSLGGSGAVAVTQEPGIATESATIETAPARGEQSQRNSRGANRRHCGQRHSRCSCRLTRRTSGHFWCAEYTPPSTLLKKPENGGCGSTQFRLHFRLALSNYGIPFAIVAGLSIATDAIGFTLQPALRAERIVRYTSPGFETLRRLQDGNISIGEAQARFVELHRSDPSLKYHLDPSGENYLQVITLAQTPVSVKKLTFPVEALRVPMGRSS